MTTYYIKFNITPTRHNPQFVAVAGGFAHCWVVEKSPLAAENRARFHISKSEWAINEIEAPTRAVTEEDYENLDVGLEQFQRAQKQGMAVIYVCWSRNGATSTGLVPFESSKNFNLNTYITRGKKLSQSGRCLHVDAGPDCSEIIQAHSIQRGGQLACIAANGHVYAVARGASALKKNDGRQTLERRGISTVSTFLGFCSKHDTVLFAPIDTQPLYPTKEQAFLYAYRSICRELFVKENGVALFDQLLQDVPADSANRSFHETFRAGLALGRHNLRWHKAIYDQALRAKDYSDLDYVLFTSRQKQTLAFSGLHFPEFGFQGQFLQDLTDGSRPFDLITFCSAPVADGWSFLFAWHRSSARSSNAFLDSLAETTHRDANCGADSMFRLVMYCCENLAVSPIWWEGLNVPQQSAVMDGLTEGTSLFTARDPSYLASGLEGISQWTFEAAQDSRN